MDQDDFFEVKKDENELKTLKSKLSDLSVKVKILQDGKDINWRETDLFKKLITAIGDYAPIRLLDELVSYYNEKKQRLITDELLSIMDEGAISSMVLDDGTKLNVKKKIKPNIVNEKDFYDWVEKNGYSDFITDTIKFGKGEFDKETEKYLQEKGLSFEKTSGIHHQTLTKIFNDREKAGELPPSDRIVKLDIFRYVEVK